MANSLSIIATPIGNREDITLRALKTLFSADILLCEDTRKTKQLLEFYRQQPALSILMSRYEIPRLVSFHEHNEERQIPQVLSWLREGQEVGLVTNAGTPTISDPGFKLVRACREAGQNVVTVPGASAAIAALSVSGLPTDKFLFLGFLPKKAGKKRKLFEAVRQFSLAATIIAYESPYRLRKTCELLQELFGDVPLTLARELTKIHEEVKTQAISLWLPQLTGKNLKGEVVILFKAETTHERKEKRV